MITESDANSLRVELAKVSSGSHSHAAGKADFYLSRLTQKPNARFSNCSAEEFVAAVRAAIYHDEWKKLGDLMARWW